jgi:hypothetical protein
MTEDKSKKVRGWEGVKVRKKKKVIADSSQQRRQMTEETRSEGEKIRR